MKLDFTTDRRLMKEGDSSGVSSGGSTSEIQQALDAANNDFNQALKDHNDAKAVDATRRILQLTQTGGLLDAAKQGAGKLATTIIDLKGDRARKRVDAAQQATIQGLQLQNTRGSAVITAEQNAAISIQQSRMIEPNTLRSLYSSIKGIGSIIDQFFHTHIAEWADKKLAEIKDPAIETGKIKNIDATITSDAGSDRLDKQADDAIAALAKDPVEVNAMVSRMSDALAARSASTTAKPTHDISLKTVNDDIAGLKKTGAIASNIDLSGAVSRAAASDGNAQTFSAKDMADLSARVEARAGKPAAVALTEKLTLEMR